MKALERRIKLLERLLKPCRPDPHDRIISDALGLLSDEALDVLDAATFANESGRAFSIAPTIMRAWNAAYKLCCQHEGFASIAEFEGRRSEFTSVSGRRHGR
jgi:hypothetical protein